MNTVPIALAALITACGSTPYPPANRTASDALPSRAKCDELLEALVDLDWRAVAARNTFFGDGYAESRFMHEKEMRDMHGPALFARCKHTPLRQIDCAITANDLDAVAACGGELTLK